MARYHDAPTRKAAAESEHNRQKYSLYLPLHPKASQRKGSVSKSDDRARKEREMAASRASVDPATGKRRATMRSKEHDDEEEQLRIAIEESKRESAGKGSVSRRNGKRNRDDSSEESKSDAKRQRRSSESAPSAARNAALEDDSDDQTVNGKGKAKGELSASARQAQLEKKEQEKERARAEAAGRRQERARSRRGDDTEQAEETTPKPTPSRKTSPPSRSSQPPSPQPAEKPPFKKGTGKKPAKKLGNNQYTKAKLELAASSPHGRKKQTNPVSGSGDDTSEAPANGESNGNKQSPDGLENATSTGTGTGKAKLGRGKKAAANGNGVKDNEPVERTFTNMTAALSNMSAYTRGQVAIMEQARATGGEGSPQSNEISLLMLGGAVQTPRSGMPQQSDLTGDGLSALEMGQQLLQSIETWQRTWGHHAGANAAPS